MRPLDNNFSGEALYKWIWPDEIPRVRANGKPSTQRIGLPGVSMQRSKHTTVEDILKGHPDGVYELSADDLPDSVPGRDSEDGSGPECQYEFRLVDDPQRGCESHCLLNVFADGHPVMSDGPIPSGPRKRLQRAVAEKLQFRTNDPAE